MKLVILLFAFTLIVFCGCGELEDTTDVTEGLSIVPSSVSLEVGKTIQFYALHTQSDGSVASVEATFSVSGGIGSISSSGLFSAEAVGTGSVTVLYNDVTASASVTVTAADTSKILAEITVSPSEVTQKVNKSITFSATGKNATGESISFDPSWSISGESIGTLSSDGTSATLDIIAEGHAWIICSSGEVSGSAYVTAEGFMVEITAEVDTYVASSEPTTSFGTSGTLIGGRVTTPSEKCYEAYIKFDLSSIPAGASIESGTALLYATDTDGNSVNLGWISSAWNEATTWNTKPTIGGFVDDHIFTSGINEIDITSTVQYWIDNTNYGLAVYAGALDTANVELVSEDNVVVEERRPKLRIEYVVP